MKPHGTWDTLQVLTHTTLTAELSPLTKLLLNSTLQWQIALKMSDHTWPLKLEQFSKVHLLSLHLSVPLLDGTLVECALKVQFFKPKLAFALTPTKN